MQSLPRLTRARWLIFAGLFLAPSAGAACPGYSVCPAVNYAAVLTTNPQAEALVSSVDANEAASVAALKAGGLSRSQISILLGQALVFDRTLSANKNEACALCHAPSAGFGDGVSAFAPAGGIFPGTVRSRAGFRTPLSLGYASFSPRLNLVTPQGGGAPMFVGGNFWDMRATGRVTGSAAADQAAEPWTNPFEMGLADPACVARRVALSPYVGKFIAFWGTESLAVAWPARTDAICAAVNDGGTDQTPVPLSAQDRTLITAAIADIGENIAAYEGSSLAAAFTAKFDAVEAGRARFTTAEAAGFKLFTGAAHCAQCHVTKPAAGPALFTDFSARNDGVPRNAAVPYLTENVADASGYIANPKGPAFIDNGVGGFLASSADAAWRAQAPNFVGTFKVPTLRNVAELPAKGVVRTYMHNGFFKSLALVVHFYNTRDILPACAGASGVGVTCWPAPEVPANENHIAGKLGLSAAQEADIVAFLGTLTDGYTAD